MSWRIFVSALTSLTISVSAFAQADERRAPPPDNGWSLYVGAGTLYAPGWPGDDDYNISAVPFLRVTYDDKFFASVQEGMGYAIINNERFKAGPLATIDFGRDEDGSSPFRIAGDKTSDLAGLGKIDFSVAIGAFADIEIAEDLEIKLKGGKALGGHDGITGQAGLDYSPRIMGIGPPLFVNIGPNIKWGDQDYTHSYFGITEDQAATSELDVFEAGSGITSFGIGGSILMPLSYSSGITLIGNYDRLSGDAAGSPLVKERGSKDQFFGGVALAYKF